MYPAYAPFYGGASYAPAVLPQSFAAPTYAPAYAPTYAPAFAPTYVTPAGPIAPAAVSNATYPTAATTHVQNTFTPVPGTVTFPTVYNPAYTEQGRTYIKNPGVAVSGFSSRGTPAELGWTKNIHKLSHLRSPIQVRALSPVWGQRKALIIGINYEGQRDNQVQGNVSDAMRQYHWLLSQGFPSQNIALLVDRSSTPPTKRNILKACKWLVANNKPGDSLYFFFAGHGATHVRPNTPGRYDAAIMALDGSIEDFHLNQALVAPLRHGTRLTAVMTCGFNNTGLDLPFTLNGFSGQYELRDESGEGRTEGDVVLFSAASDVAELQVAAIGGGQSTGALSNAILQALGRQATLGQAYEAVRQAVQGGATFHDGRQQLFSLTTNRAFDLTSPFSM